MPLNNHLDLDLGKRPVRRRGSQNPPVDDPSERLSRTRLRILLVEDEMFVAHHAADILESADYEVVAMVATADDAVEKAEELAPDLVLMDIRLLGERDGIDAAVEIRERFGVRSLFLSAYHDDGTRARAAAAEPVGFLSKPFTQKTLLDGIRRLLD